MKFGKQLTRAADTFPNSSYGAALINYKGLKKKIKKITAATISYNNQLNQYTTNEYSHEDNNISVPAEPNYNEYATQFCNTVERELSKINQFYGIQITKFQSQLHLTKQLNDSNDKYIELSELCESMNALRRYIVLNYLGVMKIVKKHDKNNKIPVAQHLIPLLYAQPFYYSRVVASLYTEVELMYLDSPDMTDESRSHRLDDYRCPICLMKLEAPVVLSCCHRFCFKCLSQLNDTTAQAKILNTCPVCISVGTPVALSNGISMLIEDVKQHDYVLGWQADDIDISKSGLTSAAVEVSVNNGVRACKRITLADGRTLVCTPDHLLLIYQHSNQSHEWVPAGQCTVGVSLAVGVQYPIYTPDTTVTWQRTYNNFTLSVNSVNSMMRSIAFCRLLGLVDSDGKIATLIRENDQYNACVYLDHMLDVEAVLADIHLLTGQSPKPYLATTVLDTTWSVNLPLPLGRAFARCNILLGKRVDQAPRYPEFITADDCPPILIRAYLSGLFGGNGVSPSLSTDTAGLNGAATEDKFHNEYIKPIRFWWFKTTQHMTVLREYYEQMRQLLHRCGVPMEHTGVEKASANACDINISDGCIVSSGGKHSLTMYIDDHVGFYKLISFAYSVHKQQRLAAVASYYTMKQTIQQQCETVVDDAINTEIVGSNISKFQQPCDNLRRTHMQYKPKTDVPRVDEWLKTIKAYEYFKDGDTEHKHHKIIELIHNDIPTIDMTCHNKSKIYAVTREQHRLPTFVLSIVDIRDAPDTQVFDLTIQQDVSSFTANGVVVHNCRKPQPLDPNNYQVDDRLLAFMKRHAPMSPASSSASSHSNKKSINNISTINDAQFITTNNTNNQCLASNHLHYDGVLDERKHVESDSEELTDDGDTSDTGTSDDDDDEPDSANIIPSQTPSKSPDANELALAKSMQHITTSSPQLQNGILQSNTLNPTNASNLSMSPFPFYNNVSTPLQVSNSTWFDTQDNTDHTLSTLQLDTQQPYDTTSLPPYNTTQYTFNDDEQIAMVEQASELMARAEDTLQHPHTPLHTASGVLSSNQSSSSDQTDHLWQSHLNYNIPEWALNAPLPLNLQRQTQKLQQYQHAFQHDGNPPPHDDINQQHNIEQMPQQMYNTYNNQPNIPNNTQLQNTLHHSLTESHLQQLDRTNHYTSSHPVMCANNTNNINNNYIQQPQQSDNNAALQSILLSVLANNSQQNGLAAAATVLLSNPQLAQLVQSQPGLADLLAAAVGQPTGPHSNAVNQPPHNKAEPIVQNGTLWLPIQLNNNHQQNIHNNNNIQSTRSISCTSPPTIPSSSMIRRLAANTLNLQTQSPQQSININNELPPLPHLPHIDAAIQMPQGTIPSSRPLHQSNYQSSPLTTSATTTTTATTTPAKRRKQRKSKQFKCTHENCDQMFKTNFSFKRHQKTHTGDKPYQCPHENCSKLFAEKSTLTRHMRVHTGEKVCYSRYSSLHYIILCYSTNITN